MNYRRLITGVATAGVAAAIVALAGPATADNPKNPTNLIDPGFGYATSAGAFNLAASGTLLNISPTKSAYCNSDHPSDSQTLATLTAGAIGTVKVLTDTCALDGYGDASSAQSIASANLLGGRLKLGAVRSDCSVADGVGSVGSVVATINGQRPNSGSGQVLNLPGLATIVINENHEVNGAMWTDAVHISVLPVYLHGHQITPAQDIVVGQCFVTGFAGD
jgi:hypothetical protein